MADEQAENPLVKIGEEIKAGKVNSKTGKPHTKEDIYKARDHEKQKDRKLFVERGGDINNYETAHSEYLKQLDELAEVLIRDIENEKEQSAQQRAEIETGIGNSNDHKKLVLASKKVEERMDEFDFPDWGSDEKLSTGRLLLKGYATAAELFGKFDEIMAVAKKTEEDSILWLSPHAVKGMIDLEKFEANLAEYDLASEPKGFVVYLLNYIQKNVPEAQRESCNTKLFSYLQSLPPSVFEYKTDRILSREYVDKERGEYQMLSLAGLIKAALKDVPKFATETGETTKEPLTEDGELEKRKKAIIENYGIAGSKAKEIEDFENLQYFDGQENAPAKQLLEGYFTAFAFDKEGKLDQQVNRAKSEEKKSGSDEYLPGDMLTEAEVNALINSGEYKDKLAKYPLSSLAKGLILGYLALAKELFEKDSPNFKAYENVLFADLDKLAGELNISSDKWFITTIDREIGEQQLVVLSKLIPPTEGKKDGAPIVKHDEAKELDESIDLAPILDKFKSLVEDVAKFKEAYPDFKFEDAEIETWLAKKVEDIKASDKEEIDKLEKKIYVETISYNKDRLLDTISEYETTIIKLKADNDKLPADKKVVSAKQWQELDERLKELRKNLDGIMPNLTDTVDALDQDAKDLDKYEESIKGHRVTIVTYETDIAKAEAAAAAAKDLPEDKEEDSESTDDGENLPDVPPEEDDEEGVPDEPEEEPESPEDENLTDGINDEYREAIEAINDADLENGKAAKFRLLFNNKWIDFTFKKEKVREFGYNLTWGKGMELPFESKDDLIRTINSGTLLQKLSYWVLRDKKQQFYKFFEDKIGPLRNPDRDPVIEQKGMKVRFELDWSGYGKGQSNAYVIAEAKPHGVIEYTLERNNIRIGENGKLDKMLSLQAGNLDTLAAQLLHFRNSADEDILEDAVSDLEDGNKDEKARAVLDLKKERNYLQMINAEDYYKYSDKIGRPITFTVEKGKKFDPLFVFFSFDGTNKIDKKNYTNPMLRVYINDEGDIDYKIKYQGKDISGTAESMDEVFVTLAVLKGSSLVLPEEDRPSINPPVNPFPEIPDGYGNA